MGANKLGPLDQLPDEEKGRNHDLHGVVRPERRYVPWLIGGVAIKDRH